MKTKKEKHVELMYNKILKEIIEPLVGDDVTYLSDLNRVGKNFLVLNSRVYFHPITSQN
jgi:hypothetical protein